MITTVRVTCTRLVSSTTTLCIGIPAESFPYFDDGAFTIAWYVYSDGDVDFGFWSVTVSYGRKHSPDTNHNRIMWNVASSGDIRGHGFGYVVDNSYGRNRISTLSEN